MVDIEFVEPVTAPETLAAQLDQNPEPDAWRRAARLRWGAVLGWLGAAALAVAAPFQLAYRVDYSLARFSSAVAPDGWGRLQRANVDFAEHDIRYGVLLCVAAGVLLLAALATASTGRWVHLPARVLRGAALGLGITGLALLAGTAAVALLARQTLLDNLRSELASLVVAQGARQGGTVETTIGAMVWLLLIAAAAGLVALVLTGLTSRDDVVRAPRPVRAEPPPDPVAEQPPAGVEFI